MHMQIQEGIGYGQNSSLGFFEVAEIDNQIKGQLAGVVDKVVKNVTKEAKGTASQTAQNLKEEIKTREKIRLVILTVRIYFYKLRKWNRVIVIIATNFNWGILDC